MNPKMKTEEKGNLEITESLENVTITADHNDDLSKPAIESTDEYKGKQVATNADVVDPSNMDASSCTPYMADSSVNSDSTATIKNAGEDVIIEQPHDDKNNCNGNVSETNGSHTIDASFPAYSDANSEGSSEDSGKGGSDIQVGPAESFSSNHHHLTGEPLILYQFELPQLLCGRLIGKFGRFVNLIKEKCNASVIVNRHPISPYYKICSIQGTRSEIRKALRIIRSRFPLHEFPDVTLHQINVINPICQLPAPQSYQLQLPEGVSCDVILSSVVNTGHIFVRQPTHPTYPSLSRLDQFMNATYSSTETPRIMPAHPGIICVVPMMNGWYRAMVVNVLNETECEVKFLDYGGYAKVATSNLRQIRVDFMSLPFQASECYLANIKPVDEAQGWSREANAVFHDLAQGQMLQAKIVAYADDGIPMIHLHKVQGASVRFVEG